MKNRDKKGDKNHPKKADNHNQKRVYLDLADKEWSSESSSLKTNTRENSLASNSSNNKVPFSKKFILNKQNKANKSIEREHAQKV